MNKKLQPHLTSITSNFNLYFAKSAFGQLALGQCNILKITQPLDTVQRRNDRIFLQILPFPTITNYIVESFKNDLLNVNSSPNSLHSKIYQIK